MRSIFHGMHVMKGILGVTISICERGSWYRNTMTEERYLCTVEFVSQFCCFVGKSEKQRELVYSTNSSIIVL
jgi:hypothetical protein